MKNANTTMKKTVAMTVVTLILSTSLLLAGCGNAPASSDSTQATEPTTATVVKDNTKATQNTTATEAGAGSTSSKSDSAKTEKATEAKDSKSSSSKADSSNSKSDSTSSKSESNTNNKQNNSTSSKPSSSSNSSTSSKPSGSSSKPSSSSKTDDHAGKTYHDAVYKTVHHDAEYKDVYVVDQEAYSYEEPIYTEQCYVVCHVCGAEFRDPQEASTFYDHIINHELAGEGSGYHSEVREIQTGTKTVDVPEKGHTEKQLVKAAYDEKVLVKEAGWY